MHIYYKTLLAENMGINPHIIGEGIIKETSKEFNIENRVTIKPSFNYFFSGKAVYSSPYCDGVEILPGSILFIRPFVPFSIKCDKKYGASRRLWLGYKGPLASYYNKYLPPHESPVCKIQNRVEFEGILRQMSMLAKDNPFDFASKGGSILIKIFTRVFSSFDCSKNVSEKREDGFSISLIKEMQKSITQKRIDIKEVAERFGYSASYAKDLFKSEISFSPHDLFIRLKAECAGHDLIFSDEPIISIAFKYGFDDDASFSRFFKREMGKSPRLYRNSLRWFFPRNGVML